MKTLLKLDQAIETILVLRTDVYNDSHFWYNTGLWPFCSEFCASMDRRGHAVLRNLSYLYRVRIDCQGGRTRICGYSHRIFEG